MGTRPHRAWRFKAALTAILITTACNGGGSSAVSVSPSPSSSSPANAAYGVLVSNQLFGMYTLSLVGIDGQVAASADASTPYPVSCGDMSAPIPLLPVSTSNSRAYYMDASGAVRWVAPNGRSDAPIVTLPALTVTRHTMFAVSPDDRQMAVVVADYAPGDATATTNLYMYDLNKSGTQKLLYTQTGARTLWPVGWHAGNLVVAAAPTSCAGSDPFCCGMQELHVVDPTTADRRYTLGSWGTCPIAGAPSPAGVVCEDLGPHTGATVLSWTGATLRSLRFAGYVSLYLSPNGANVATVERGGTALWNWVEARFDGAKVKGIMSGCSWIDDTHLLGKGIPQEQHALIADITDGHVIAVAAAGDCGGRIPGGL